MDLGGGSEIPPPSPPVVEAFKKLVAAAGKRLIIGAQQKFVKKLDNIPMVVLPVEETCRSALNLARGDALVSS